MGGKSELLESVDPLVGNEATCPERVEVEEEEEPEEDSGKSKKKGKNKKGKSKSGVNENTEEVAKGDLTCAQCRNPFPSKNKLYDHLKSTGHAVYLPSSASNLTENKRAKAKKKK